MLRFKIIAIALVAFMAAGCQQASQKPVEETPVATTPPPKPTPPPRPTPPPKPPEPMPPPLWQTNKIVYFDFDRSDIRANQRNVVMAHAENLADNPAQKVRLEGHADERGSREYNIGLGERRAQSVRQALMLNGVQSGQIETLSYGEERPAMRGSGESVWAQNRRVEIVYLP